MDVAQHAYYQEEIMCEEDEDDEDDEVERINPRDVGHNIYILAHQVSDITSSEFAHVLLVILLVIYTYIKIFVLITHI